MHIDFFKHKYVQRDGTIRSEEGGHVETRGSISMSPKSGGCSIDNCTCSEGHWITILHPRTDKGTVVGFTAHFESEEEMQAFFENRILIGKTD